MSAIKNIDTTKPNPCGSRRTKKMKFSKRIRNNKRQSREINVKVLTTALSSNGVLLFSAARTMEEMMKKKAMLAEYTKSWKKRIVSTAVN